MKRLRGLLMACALALALPAMAQFQWIDLDGRRVFSDHPPPANIPDQNIISGWDETDVARRAAEAAAERQRASEESQAEAESDDASRSAAAQEQQEKEQQEQRARQEEEARIAAIRAENCRRAQNSRRALESGMRIARMNDQGERIVLDDAQRADEIRRADEIIASDCS